MKNLLFLLFTITTFFANAQNSGLEFDGSNDYVNLGTTVADNIRSIEFWFKPTDTITSLSDAQGLVFRWNGGSPSNQNNIGVFIGAANIGDNGKIVFQRNINTTVHKVVSDASTWVAGKWYHVAGVIDPVNGMELYIDGVKQQSTNATVNASATNSDLMAIGRWGASAIRHFKGSIDEVRIWDRAITQSEINMNFCDTISSTAQTGLKGYWRLNEGFGNVAYNTGASSLNGAISGATWGIDSIQCTTMVSINDVKMEE